jgi:hypothetical protein
VYRYFGGSKEEILINALRTFTNEFYGFTEKKTILTLPERIQKARSYVFKNPEAIIFYQTWRARDSSLREEFNSIEKKFQRKLKKLFPQFDDTQILAAHTCIHGLVTAPFLTPEQASKICGDLEKKAILS